MRLGRGCPFAIILESCGTAATGARSVAWGGTHEVSPAALAVVTQTRALKRFARSLHISLSQHRGLWVAKEAWGSVPANHAPCHDRTRTSRLTGSWVYEASFPYGTGARGPPGILPAKHFL